jgi:acyl carrier protein
VPATSLSQTGLDVNAVVAVVSDVLAVTQADPRPATAETRLEELGMSSLDFAELLAALEEAAGGEIDMSSVAGLETVEDLVRLRRL